MKQDRIVRIATWYLRLALGVGFLSAVADRLGIWCTTGTSQVAWGDWSHFCAYTAKLNWFLPKALIPAVAWLSTLAETFFGLALVFGWFLRPVAFASAGLLSLFALAMVTGIGVKAPLDYSVFSAAAGAMLLASISEVQVRSNEKNAACSTES